MSRHRINEIAKQLELLNLSNCQIADIGTDHGILPLILLDKKLINYAILTDINKGPLDNARGLFGGHYRHLKKVEFRISNGLENLSANDNIDLAFICGMGGNTIKSILNQASFLPNYLILQPMNEQDEVRNLIKKYGYSILWDYIVKDGHFYQIIVASLISEKCNAIPINININSQTSYKILPKNIDVFREFIEFSLHKINRILCKLNKEKHFDLYNEHMDLKNKLSEVLNNENFRRDS